MSPVNKQYLIRRNKHEEVINEESYVESLSQSFSGFSSDSNRTMNPNENENEMELMQIELQKLNSKLSQFEH